LKILQVSDAYYPFPGGVSEHLYSLSKYLRKRGHEVWILSTSYGKDDEKFNGYVCRVGRVLILPLNKSQITLTFDPLLPLKVLRFLRERKFDIVHTRMDHNTLPLPRRLNLPHILRWFQLVQGRKNFFHPSMEEN
jgi:glycosyltransferase involved in cell wall biosynthesis